MPNYLKQILHTQLFSVLNIIFGFATLFILIKYMPVIAYGEYVLIQGFIAFGGLVLSQNIYAYSRLHIPGAEVHTQYGYLKTVITIIFAGYFSLLIISKIFHLDQTIFNFFEIDNSISYLVLIMLGFELVNLEFMRFFIALKKIYLKNYAQFFQKAFILAGASILLTLNLLTLENFLYLFIAGQLLVFGSFVNAVDRKRLLQSPFLSDVIRKGYLVAIPLLPIGLMSIALNYTDTLMIAKFIDKIQVAQYGFASQIIVIAMMMIGSSIVLTLFPYATEAHNKNDIELRTEFFLKMFKFGSLLALIFYFLMTINAHWMLSLVDLENYSDVPYYLSVLAIFPFFQLLYSVSSHHLQLINFLKVQVYYALFVMLENLILNYFFIQTYGVIGAAYASLISYITLFILYAVTSLRYDNYLYRQLVTLVINKTNMVSLLLISISLFIIHYFKMYENTSSVLLWNIAIIMTLYILWINHKNKKEVK